MIDNNKELVAEFVRRVFQDAGAILENGHFVYSSGRHGRAYADHYAIYANRPMLLKLCSIFVDCLDEAIGQKIDVVVGPEGGGALLSAFIAQNLERRFGRIVASVWAKKEYRANGEKFFNFPEAFKEVIFQKNVFLADDAVTTGGTFQQMIALISVFGGKVVGCGCLWNRGGVVSADLYDIPLFSLLEKKLEDWLPADCPLCQSGIPVNTKFGHGRNPR